MYVNKLFNSIFNECESSEENLFKLDSAESYSKILRETRFSAGLHRKLTINDDSDEKYPKKNDSLNSQMNLINKMLSLGKLEGNQLLHGVDTLKISFTETEPTSTATCEILSKKFEEKGQLLQIKRYVFDYCIVDNFTNSKVTHRSFKSLIDKIRDLNPFAFIKFMPNFTFESSILSCAKVKKFFCTSAKLLSEELQKINIRHKFSFSSKIDDLMLEDWDTANMNEQAKTQISMIIERTVKLMGIFQESIAKTTINNTLVSPFIHLDGVKSISSLRNNCFAIVEASINEFISMHNLWKDSDTEMKPAWGSFKIAEIPVQGEKFQYEGENNAEVDSFFDLMKHGALPEVTTLYISNSSCSHEPLMNYSKILQRFKNSEDEVLSVFNTFKLSYYLDMKFSPKPIFEVLKDCLCDFSNLKQLTLIPKNLDFFDDLEENVSHQIDHETALRDLADFARTKNILLNIDLSELKTNCRIDEVLANNYATDEVKELIALTMKVAIEGILKAVTQTQDS